MMIKGNKMQWVVVNSATGLKFAHPRTGKTHYKTDKAARTTITRLFRTDENKVPSRLDIMTEKDYNAKVGTKVVKNLMSGKDVTIARDTPLCCDPSSETYWSS